MNLKNIKSVGYTLKRGWNTYSEVKIFSNIDIREHSRPEPPLCWHALLQMWVTSYHWHAERRA